jgi:hypothetical protein
MLIILISVIAYLFILGENIDNGNNPNLEDDTNLKNNVDVEKDNIISKNDQIKNSKSIWERLGFLRTYPNLFVTYSSEVVKDKYEKFNSTKNEYIYDSNSDKSTGYMLNKFRDKSLSGTETVKLESISEFDYHNEVNTESDLDLKSKQVYENTIKEIIDYEIRTKDKLDDFNQLMIFSVKYLNKEISSNNLVVDKEVLDNVLDKLMEIRYDKDLVKHLCKTEPELYIKPDPYLNEKVSSWFDFKAWVDEKKSAKTEELKMNETKNRTYENYDPDSLLDKSKPIPYPVWWEVKDKPTDPVELEKWESDLKIKKRLTSLYPYLPEHYEEMNREGKNNTKDK